MAIEPIVLNLGSGGSSIAADKIAGLDYEVVKQGFGDAGSVTLVSPTNPLPTTESPAATIFNGVKAVSVAGTRVAIASSQAIKSVTIKALSTNTDLIFVGNSLVSSSNGFQLSAKDSISLDVANLATVFIDAVVSGESISFIAIN